MICIKQNIYTKNHDGSKKICHHVPTFSQYMLVYSLFFLTCSKDFSPSHVGPPFRYGTGARWCRRIPRLSCFALRPGRLVELGPRDGNSQMLHVKNIYLHLGEKIGVNVATYSSTMELVIQHSYETSFFLVG